MVTFIGTWESGWLEPKVEAFMFRQLRSAFQFERLVMVPENLEGHKTSVHQYATMEAALSSSPGRRVFLEPKGKHRWKDVPLDEDLVFVMGCAGTSNMKLVRDDDIVLRIDTPSMSDMFAVNAAAIILDRLNERR